MQEKFVVFSKLVFAGGGVYIIYILYICICVCAFDSDLNDKGTAWKLAFKVERTNKQVFFSRTLYALYVNNFDDSIVVTVAML